MNTRIKEQESLRNLKEVVPMLGAIERADGKKVGDFKVFLHIKTESLTKALENPKFWMQKKLLKK